MQALEVYERLGVQQPAQVDAWVVLNHGERDKGRLKTATNSGDAVHIFLERGTPLLVGELLRTRCGKLLQVEGAPEPVLTATCDDWAVFSRACYHLGNRHVKMQVGDRWLRIVPDHVLEQMLLLLGLQVQHEVAVFLPEAGAYRGLVFAHHHH
jgi:urease accessory protein